MTDDVTTPLDDNAVAQLREFLDAGDARDAAEERRVKARDALIAYLATREANVGMVDEVPAIRFTQYSYERIDEARLKVEEPFTFHRFARLVRVEKLSSIRRPR